MNSFDIAQLEGKLDEIDDLKNKVNKFKTEKSKLMSDHSGQVNHLIDQINTNVQHIVDMIDKMKSVLSPVKEKVNKLINTNRGYVDMG